MSRLRRHYGASPLHVIAHVALLALFAWVVLVLVDAREATNMLVWFIAAIVVHDLVLLPLYSAIDHAGRRLERRDAVNHVRIPTVLSGLLLLLFFPPILGLNDTSFARVAGEEPSGYLQRWLLVTAVLFAASTLLYVVRSRSTKAAASTS